MSILLYSPNSAAYLQGISEEILAARMSMELVMAGMP